MKIEEINLYKVHLSMKTAAKDFFIQEAKKLDSVIDVSLDDYGNILIEATDSSVKKSLEELYELAKQLSDEYLERIENTFYPNPVDVVKIESEDDMIYVKVNTYVDFEIKPKTNEIKLLRGNIHSVEC